MKSVTINVPHTYAIGETIDFSLYQGGTIQNGAIGKWNGIIIDTTNDGADNGKFDSRWLKGTGNDIQCNVGTVLTFNVEVGITDTNITVIDYNGNPVTNGAWEVTVDGGVATVACKTTAGNCNYIKSIVIA